MNTAGEKPRRTLKQTVRLFPVESILTIILLGEVSYVLIPYLTRIYWEAMRHAFGF